MKAGDKTTDIQKQCKNSAFIWHINTKMSKKQRQQIAERLIYNIKQHNKLPQMTSSPINMRISYKNLKKTHKR